MTRLMRLVMVALLALGSSRLSAAEESVGRMVVVVRDRTPSFQKYFGAADACVLRIVDALGPGDRMLLVELGGGRFDPTSQVAEWAFPAVTSAVVTQPTNLAAFHVDQRALSEAWAPVPAIKAAIAAAVGHPTKPKDGTDIPTVIDYVAHRVSQASGTRDARRQVLVVLLTDLETDAKGQMRSALPPRNSGTFPKAEVTALFVPWTGSSHSGSQLTAWRDWFIAHGAKSFTMFDEAQSLSITPVAPSAVPHQPVNPFASLRSAK